MLAARNNAAKALRIKVCIDVLLFGSGEDVRLRREDGGFQSG
jgi:hypothetical protein